MNACDLFCAVFSSIRWGWFALAVVIAYGVGALWYSVLFPKAWIRVFKIDLIEPTPGLMLRTLGLQLIVQLLFGLGLFMITALSGWIALLALIGFCGWEKGELNFQFVRMKDYIPAALIRVSYTCIAGGIYILFGLI